MTDAAALVNGPGPLPAPTSGMHSGRDERTGPDGAGRIGRPAGSDSGAAAQWQNRLGEPITRDARVDRRLLRTG